MSKSASKRSKQSKGNGRARRRHARSTKQTNAKTSPVKRRTKDRPWREHPNHQVGNVVDPSPAVGVLFVSLDKYPEDRGSGDRHLTDVVVPPIVVPLDEFYRTKVKKSPSKAVKRKEKPKVAVPPPIRVPLDEFVRAHRQKRKSKSPNKPVVPPPIVIPLDKFRQSQKKPLTKTEVPPPIFIPLDKFRKAQQKRKKPLTTPEVPPPIVVPLDGFRRAPHTRKQKAK